MASMTRVNKAVILSLWSTKLKIAAASLVFSPMSTSLFRKCSITRYDDGGIFKTMMNHGLFLVSHAFEHSLAVTCRNLSFLVRAGIFSSGSKANSTS